MENKRIVLLSLIKGPFSNYKNKLKWVSGQSIVFANKENGPMISFGNFGFGKFYTSGKATSIGI